MAVHPVIRIQLFLLLIQVFSGAVQPTRGQQIVINEVMPSNQEGLVDEDKENSDWIEVFNPGDKPVNLAGYTLSDTRDNLNLWGFPDTVLWPRSFLIVFASGKNRALTGHELHTNFRIRSSGEKLYLSYEGTLLQVTPEFDMGSLASFGLYPDGGTHYAEYRTPSPGAKNTSEVHWDLVAFSTPGGVYTDAFELALASENQRNRVFFTIDGSLPNTGSILYTRPVILSDSLCSKTKIGKLKISPDNLYYPAPERIPEGIVIRAAAFDPEGNRVSDIETQSYFIRQLGINHKKLPILSLAAAYNDLFDYYQGILVPGVAWEPQDPDWTGNYYQRGDAWEIGINVEFYDPETETGFNQQAGLRTHGGNGRRLPQKGLKLYAREQYGSPKFTFPFFPNQDNNSYTRLVLRPFYSSWSQVGFEDHLSQAIARTVNVDAMASRPVVVYLNGEYWGIYYLQESPDEYYISDHYGIEPDKVNMTGNWYGIPEAGDPADFLNLFDFVEDQDLRITENYQRLSEWMDIDNFIDYQLFEIYFSNHDWPANNMKCWLNPERGQWRWLFYDGDACLSDYRYNGFESAIDTVFDNSTTHARATLFLRKLLTNKDFYGRFFNRLNDLTNNQLTYQSIKSSYQSCVETTCEEVKQQIERFGFPIDYPTWVNRVDRVFEFLIERPCEIQRQVSASFNEEIQCPLCEKPADDIRQMGIFPSPNNGSFICTLNSDRTLIGRFSVINPLGQVIRYWDYPINEGINNIEINDPNLPDGLLILTVNTGIRIFSFRFIKTR